MKSSPLEMVNEILNDYKMEDCTKKANRPGELKTLQELLLQARRTINRQKWWQRHFLFESTLLVSTRTVFSDGFLIEEILQNGKKTHEFWAGTGKHPARWSWISFVLNQEASTTSLFIKHQDIEPLCLPIFDSVTELRATIGDKPLHILEKVPAFLGSGLR